MLRFETELQELSDAGALEPAAAAQAMAVDRGALYSLYWEMRLAMYAAVALISIGLGVLLRQNLQRIGPLAMLGAMAAAAAPCYATALRSRRRGATRSLVGDYLLLLGAMLVSAGIGYGESQFHWFGAHWARHLLLIALLHGAAAYYFDSRLLLSLALASFAAWLGIEPAFGNPFWIAGSSMNLGWRALECAALVYGWRELSRRRRLAPQFQELFDHFALLMALGAGLLWCFHAHMRPAGLLVLALLGPGAVFLGRRRASELMIVYGVAYPAAGMAVVSADLIDTPVFSALMVLAIVAGAATLLWRLRVNAAPSA